MANERITENLVRDKFKSDPLFEVIKLEEQKSKSKKIRDLLQNASKSRKGNVGYPEFLITFPSENINYLIVVECKAETHYHISEKLDKPKDYAVDGVLHYGRYLAKEFNVLAIAASGQNKNEFTVSTYKFEKGKTEHTDKEIDTLLSVNDYLKLFENENFAENLRNIDILQKSVYLNEEFNSYSITENSRCTIVSGILLSLLDSPFKSSYATYKNTNEVADAMLEAIKRVLKSFSVRNKDSIINEFNKILNEPIFKQKIIKKGKEEKETIKVVKEDFIDYIYRNVYPLIDMEDAGVDVLGKFYTEFIRYAGSSQKQGLVLTLSLIHI